LLLVVSVGLVDLDRCSIEQLILFPRREQLRADGGGVVSGGVRQALGWAGVLAGLRRFWLAGVRWMA
jgi:hypothetical protein